MMTRNAYFLNMGFVMERAPVKPERALLESNMGGDKKPSYEYFQEGHGKTVIAEATLTEDAIRRVLRTTVDDLLELSWAERTAPSPRGCSRSPSRRRLRSPRSSPRRDRTSEWSERARCATAPDGGWRTAARGPAPARPRGQHRRRRTTLPYARSWLALMDCAGPGKVYRFAQIVAAATLALEISASAAMATAGSANFFQAHFERGGMR